MTPSRTRAGRRCSADPLRVLALFAVLATSCAKSTSPVPPPPVTGPTFDFPFPAQNVSHAFQFTEAGDWDYNCRPHKSSGMIGTIRVRESSVRDSAFVGVGQGGFFFVPDTVTIRLGGTIRWVNVSAVVNHTASRP